MAVPVRPGPGRSEGAATPSPDRLVLVRLHALGDTIITLPLLAALRHRYPNCRLEVVTTPQSAPLFEGRLEVDRVWSLDLRHGPPAAPRQAPLRTVGLREVAEAFAQNVSELGGDARRLWEVQRLGRAIATEPLDAVIDLQRSRWSRLLTRFVAPPAYVFFDRYAPRTALTRYLEAVAWVGLERLEPRFEPALRPALVERASALLEQAGHDPSRSLVCLNPAGGWVTKQWPIERYVALGRRLERHDGAQVLLLGAGRMLPRVEALREGLGPGVVDLCGRTTLDEAMAVVARCALMVSEDSGLMHLAWTQGVPTLALFGSTRATWSRPEGPGSTGFHSEDLDCGACMRPVCARGDLLCLARVSVESVIERLPIQLTRGG